MAAAGEDGAAGGCSPSPPAPAGNPGREELMDFIVELFLRKFTEAAGYQRFARCYSRLYRAQPELTRCIYDQFICHLQGAFREEIQELKREGNLTELLGSLDKLAEEAKQRESPAWRPSGIPEEDVRSALVPYFLKQRKYLQKSLKEKEEVNAKLAQSVLAGREKIANLQEEIRKRKEEWQAAIREGREIVNALDEIL